MITDTMMRGIGMTSQRTRDRLINRLREQGVSNHTVLEVMLNTPRHLFVDEALSSRAYEDSSLPIGHGQTISQPYIVARMTELLLAGGMPQKVLEVGTGCGYQTTILSQLVPQVFTVERIDALLQQARKRFRMFKLTNIRPRHSDGKWGWEEAGPFQGIIVTAAPTEIPQALLQQLEVGGRLIIPVGEKGAQQLSVVTRTEKNFEQELYESVTFVPLLGGEA
jgi:protein-L-isoaspartate(D-aspartate) O-methyltransferase